MLIDVRVFSVDVIMNYAFKKIEQKNSTKSSLFCFQNLVLKSNSIWSRSFISSKQNLHKITWTLVITAKHFKLHRWTSSFLRCSDDLVRAFVISQSFSMKVNLKMNNVASVFTRDLTFVIESSIIIVDDVNDESDLISYSECTIDFEVRIDLENSMKNVMIFRLKFRAHLDKREENDHIFFTNISNHRLSHSLNSRQLFRTAKAQRCKKRARQASSKEKWHNELKSEEKQSQGAKREWLERTLPFLTCSLSRIVIFYASFASKTTLRS